MASNADTPLTRDESLKRLQEQQTELEDMKGTIQNIISDLQQADSGLWILSQQLGEKREKLATFITSLPTADHVIRTAEDLRRATEPYLPPSWGIVDELRKGANSLMKIWDVVGVRGSPRHCEEIPPEYRLDIKEANHVYVTENLVEITVRPEKTQKGDATTTSDAAHLQPRETTGATRGQHVQIQHAERVMVPTRSTVVNLQLGPISINSITDDKVIERAVQDVLITKIDWPEEIARAHELTREKQKLTRQLNSKLSETHLEKDQKKADARLKELYRHHQEEKMKERKNARRFVMKLQEEKVKLKQEVLKKIRKKDSMSATIQKLFDDFDVRLLGVDSGLRFLMDTPFEEYAEVEQREQDIRGTVGKVLLEGCEVKWGKTTPCDHQADIADLQLGKALPVSDRVMAFDPLTATARRTFCVDNSQLMIQGEKDTPCITSLVVTEGGQLIMADMTNSKVKVMDSVSPATVRSLPLRVSPWGLAILYDDKVAVTAFSDNVIHLIDVTVHFQIVQQIKTSRRYKGVGCGGKDGTLVVSCRKEYEQPASVDLLSRGGQLIRTVVSGHELSNLQFPEYLCVDGTDILVSDNGAKSVFRVELATGRMKATYTHRQLQSPQQLSVDRSGNLYIVSFMFHGVLVMGVDGRWRTLLRGEEHGEGEHCWPRCVAVTETGVVVEWHDTGVSCVVTGFDLT